MEKFDLIFNVVTYKNYQDLIVFIENLEKKSLNNFTYKIIIVNNFADIESLNIIKNIASTNKCDFIENKNKGYGHGNNVGIEYANLKYRFDYLIICNPDTEIIEFNINNLVGFEKKIIAPEIASRNGKKQNPMYFRYMPFSEWCVYQGFKYRKKTLINMGILINRISRMMFNFFHQSKGTLNIYACHGSYIILSNHALKKLSPIFDEDIFLFSEENILAIKSRRKEIDIVFNNKIRIFHKEDGSMNTFTGNLNEIQRNSYLLYYENYIRSNG